MKEFSIIFLLYTPVYLYSFMTVALLCFLALNISKNTSPSFYIFQSSNPRNYKNFIFLIFLLALMGTPPTLGFFSKILVFMLLVNQSVINFILVLGITLILLIFYLQASRTKNIQKKQIGSQTNLKTTPGHLIFTFSVLTVLLLSPISFVYLFDIVSCFFL